MISEILTTYPGNFKYNRDSNIATPLLKNPRRTKCSSHGPTEKNSIAEDLITTQIFKLDRERKRETEVKTKSWERERETTRSLVERKRKALD